ncbi:hypothetical protein [Pseudomonas sessilinigenes]|uniref:Uncharacterized protein n=1 Tax=Pseudomonas sessilinigenes TaxID=658629 RepID=A0ABX8MSE0_9PSED|nr:hypothetical protein [Pseudomonas sessilinigenes]QXH42213.1 hypothetical protein KSS89_08335 [Pseudomonas sessilinigenes]
MSNEPIPCPTCGQFCGDQFDQTCDELRTRISTGPLLNVPREMLQQWMDDIGESRHVTRYAARKREELRALLAQPAEPVVSPGDENFSHLSTIELRGYHKGWAAASAIQLAEITRLKGLQPDLPPRPPEGEGLPRYGLRWNGPQQPLATPMDDGYWTPWHLANELHKDAERYQWLIRRISKSQYYLLGAQLTSNTVEGVDAAIDAAMAQEVQP